MTRYTYEYIQNQIDETVHVLDEATLHTINNLMKELDLSASSKEVVTIRRNERSFDRSNRNKKRGRGITKVLSTGDIDDWEAIRNFKPTIIVELSDFQKQLNEIRSLLNKVTKENCITMKEAICEKVSTVYQSLSENKENQKKIVDTVFEICTSHKFLSEIYADIYVELIGHVESFGTLLETCINDYKTSLNSIQYADPDDDYDGFCEFNKTNEKRKSMALFIVNVMKHDMISKNDILSLITDLHNISCNYIELENKYHEVEEITENVFLLVTHSKPILSGHESWKTNIEPSIRNFAKLKTKEHMSLSSRALFKYMDML